MSKTPKLRSSNVVQQVKTTPLLSPSIEYAIVFFALLLALSIVVCVLWLGKRSGQTVPDQEAQRTAQNEDILNTGADFRIRRMILLPSIPETETAKTGESPVGSSLRKRSTGLLGRYGETNQD